MPLYAVARGYAIGIYEDADVADYLVTGYNGGMHSKFESIDDANYFIRNNLLQKVPDVEEAIYQCSISTDPEPQFRQKLSCKDVRSSFESVKVWCGGVSRDSGVDAIAGYGVYIPDHQYCASVAYDDINTDSVPSKQAMDLLAVKHALARLCVWINEGNPPDYYDIYTDSKYVINCITKWGPKWKQDRWKKQDGDRTAHTDLISQCVELVETLCRVVRTTDAVRFIQIRRGVSGNVVTEKLANMACDRM